MEDDTLQGMKDLFGEEQTAEYIMLAKAVRSMVWVWTQYAEAERNSFVEHVVGAQFEKMIDDLKTHPNHAAAMVEAMVAVIVHMRNGGTYEHWMESLGLDPAPDSER